MPSSVERVIEICLVVDSMDKLVAEGGDFIAQLGVLTGRDGIASRDVGRGQRLSRMG